MDLRLPTCRDWFLQDLESWERLERKVMQQVVRPGMVVFDIGANIGLQTSYLSSLVGPSGHVFAFEPNPMLGNLLKRTCQSLPNATFFPTALSDEKGTASFYIPMDHTMAGFQDWTRLPTERSEVEMDRLDDLNLPQPDFIKCDVEGAELKVFKGALRTLSGQPTILFEINEHTVKPYNQPATAALDFLKALDVYDFFQVTDAEEVPFDHFNGNVLAVPKKREC